jgi:phosphonoacetaldehyde hydrolase
MDMDSLEEVDTLSESEIDRRLGITRELLQKAGSHYVIDTWAEMPDVIEDINVRLGRGERP